MISKKEKKKKNDNRDRADRDYLSIQVSFRAFLHRGRNLAHALVARRLANDGRDQKESEGEPDDRAQHRQWHAGIEKA